MTNLGPLKYFLGISAQHTAYGMFLSQHKYAIEILDRANMTNCNPSRTPVESDCKLDLTGPSVSDPSSYRILSF